MNENSRAADRLDALEMRIAHQDAAIAELIEAVTGQWGQIEALERQISRLLEEVGSMPSRREEPEPPPPHY